MIYLAHVVDEFHLPANFFEEDEEDIIIVEHNDIWNDPIYWSSGDEDNEDKFQNGYESADSAYVENDEDNQDSDVSWDGEDSVTTFPDLGFYGWLSSDDEQEMEAAVGYAIDYDLINQQDDVWEAFILATRSNLLGDYDSEWYWFYRQQIEDHLWDIRRGYSIEECPDQHQRYD